MIAAFHTLKTKTWFQLVFALLIFKLFQVFNFYFFYSGINGEFSKIGLQDLTYTPLPWHSFSVILTSILHPAIMLALFVLILSSGMYKKINWQSTYESSTERWLVFIPALLLTWELTTLGYNYYLDAAYYPDRILLILTCLLVWQYPLAVPVFVAVVLMYRAQFNYPIGGFSLADKRVPLDVLMMFSTVLLVRKKINVFNHAFIYLVICIIAAHYVGSGLGKILKSPHGYEWITGNDLNDFFFNAHARGWMPNLKQQTAENLFTFFNSANIVLHVLVLLAEILMVFVFWHRKTAIMLFSGTVIMHLFIFLTGSMLFWKWMLIDITLIVILIRFRNNYHSLFTSSLKWISIPVILSAFIWLKPIVISWHDTPFNQFFTYEVMDKNGKTWNWPKNAFEPYDAFFQTDVFLYLVNHKTTGISGFGYTGRYKLAKEIKNAGMQSYQQVEEKWGVNRYDSTKVAAFKKFMVQFFTMHNKRKNKWVPFTLLHAPLHLHNGAQPPVYNNLQPVVRVKIYYNQTWRNRSKITRLKKELCAELDIPA